MHKHGTKTTLLVLPADGEPSWSLIPSSASLLPGSTMQSETSTPVSSRSQVRSENAKKG